MKPLDTISKPDTVNDLPRIASTIDPEIDSPDPDLARILEAWPTLPEPIRRAMLALVGAR
ncbi:MAG: hypothetical protein K1X57_10570 [Gemmataceae bacterium]|nr:hypothetical protein [Gemmataceae bacterium]